MPRALPCGRAPERSRPESRMTRTSLPIRHDESSDGLLLHGLAATMQMEAMALDCALTEVIPVAVADRGIDRAKRRTPPRPHEAFTGYIAARTKARTR